jgi:hypothetical protein
MRLAIIGNGPSQALYEPSIDYDLVVGCNYPRFRVDVSAFADARACRLMRKDSMQHHRLGDFQVVLGERSASGLKRCKDKAGGLRTFYDLLEDAELIEDVVVYPDWALEDQRSFNSGHLAFLWACSQEPYLNASYDLFGFDSVFGRTPADSTSLIDVPLGDGTELDMRIKKSEGTLNEWNPFWIRLLNYCRYDCVAFHGYEGDPPLPFEGVKNVKSVFHLRTGG